MTERSTSSDDADPARDVPSGETFAPGQGAGRVLLVIGDAGRRIEIGRLLMEEGFEVEAGGDGGPALTAARQRPPDLVVSDAERPGLAAALRDVPVIVLSAPGDGGPSGAPFAARELVARVGASLWRARARREAALRASYADLEREVAERIRAEAGMGRAAALTAAQNRVLELAVRDTPLAATLEAIVTTVEGLSSSGVIASILLVDADGVHLRHGAAPNLPDAYNAAVDGIATGPGAGSCGTAVHRRAPVFVADIATDPLWDDYRALALAHGLRACWSIPIVSGGGAVLGTFAMYHRSPREPTPGDLEVVDFVVRSSALAIERTRARQALDESSAALRRLNESLESEVALRTAERDRIWRLLPDLLVTGSIGGALRSLNPAWETVLGFDAATLLAGSLQDLVHPDDLAAGARADEAMRRGQTARYENRVRTKDGGYRWFDWVSIAAGETFYAVARDITELKRREADLEQAQEALRQSQKMEAVGQLTGGLAHDFNNLLAGISGSLELMQTRMQLGRVSDVERYMAAAQGAAKRAAALTHRLLAFSRRQTLDPRPTNVNRLVADMQEMVQRTVGPGIALEVVGVAGSWPALVDPSQLENALLNLCINARDAMPDGGRITVETANKWLDERAARMLDMPEGQYLSLCVTDTGVGMPKEVLERVFEPFFTTKPIGQGTGLGLSMIYGFARQSGGQVRVYSEVGQGTTVCIYLPRHHAAAADDEPALAAAMPLRSAQGETVLVVDDEPTVRMLVADILEELGHTAIEAQDSAVGLRILQSGARIDLLVTDVGLPGGMNGRQMADAARVVRPGLKVLFITGYAENAVLGDGHLAPGMAVLTKPFSIDTMAARIRSMIEAG